MDRNSIIGLLLIAVILIGYSIWSSPSQEEVEAAKRTQDSIITAQQAEQRAREETKEIEPAPVEDLLPEEIKDSLQQAQLLREYGIFADAASGEQEYYFFENELLKLKISSKGGRIVSAELKKYQKYNEDPLILFEEETSKFAFNFTAGNQLISTQNLFFNPQNKAVKVSGNDSASFTLKMSAGGNRSVEYIYGLKGNSYLVDFKVRLNGFNEIIPPQSRNINLYWSMLVPNHEKSMENQRMNTTVYYGLDDDDYDYLSETSDDKTAIKENTSWIGFKQQFFSSALIADKFFEKEATVVESFVDPNAPDFVKQLSASIAIPFNHNQSEFYDMEFYFGPNHYQTLNKTDYGLEKMVPLGWGIFGWVNKFLVIPVFNFLAGFKLNFGIVILILTILIKIILFPLTYKAYLSTAKMRVLKPEIEELNKKFSKEEALKKQQAVMSLYKKAGVNPLGGCLPMVLQFPILIAMFRFFPASIELRQESFLWAEDLSTYDSIFDLPFEIPFYGDHVSLFTILMTISTIIYTRMNSQLSSSPEMAQMKWMMYLMPIIFLGIFNNYASGLSYYYFLANVITFGQQFAMQKMVDEKALLAKIEEFKKRPEGDKKSSFQKRLEDAAKKRGYKLPK